MRERVVIPSQIRHTTSKQAHKSHVYHGDRYETYNKIANAFWWPGVYKDIATHVNKCQTCINKTK